MLSGSLTSWRGALLVAGCLGLSACATMHADSDYYAAADFSGYRRFAWVSDSPLIHSSSSRVEISALSIRRIREAIERDLTGKGFELTEAREDADFAVSFTVGARDMIRVEDYPPYFRRPWHWRPRYYWPNVDVDMYTEGMLAVDIFDNATGEPVWHGWLHRRIVGADIRDPQAAINEAVDAILARFPPTPGA